MTIPLAFDIGLAGLILVIGSWTVFARETLAAIIGFVSYGLLLAIIWIRLSAPDVALTEAAIGSGMTGMLLLGAAARVRGRAFISQASVCEAASWSAYSAP